MNFMKDEQGSTRTTVPEADRLCLQFLNYTLINSSQVISQVNITGNGTSMYYLKNWNFQVEVLFHFNVFVKFDVVRINGRRKFADYCMPSDAVSPNLKENESVLNISYMKRIDKWTPSMCTVLFTNVQLCSDILYPPH